MARRRGNGFQPTTIRLEGGLDLIHPPLSRNRRPGACVWLQNYVPEEEGYRQVDGYARFRTQPVPVADALESDGYTRQADLTADYSAGSLSAGEIAKRQDAQRWYIRPKAGQTLTELQRYIFKDGPDVVFAATDNTRITLSAITNVFVVMNEALLVECTATDTVADNTGGTLRVDRDALARLAGLPIYAIAQGAFSAEGGAVAASTVAGLGGLDVGSREVQDGDSTSIETTRTHVRRARFFTPQSRVDEPLTKFTDEAVAFQAPTSETAGGAGAAGATDAGVDIYVFRKQADGKLGVFQAPTDDDADWIKVPIDRNVRPTPTNPTLTEELDAPSPGSRVRWLSRSFSAAGAPRLFFVTGRGPELGLYEIVNINGQKAIRGHYIGTEDFDANWTHAQQFPQYVQAHQGHLFLGYVGGAVIWSALGDPTDFSAIIGAGEISFPNIGTILTGLLPSYQRRLWVFGSDSVHYIDGATASTFSVRPLTEEVGAAPDTLQIGDTPLFFSNTGILRIAQGDAINATTEEVSRYVEPLIQQLTADGVHSTVSLLLRDKSQYRVYFSNGTALVGTLLLRGRRGLVWEFSTLRYPRSVNAISNTSAPRDTRGQVLADRTLLAFGREDTLGVPVEGDACDGLVYIDGPPPDGGEAPNTFADEPIFGIMQLGTQLLQEPSLLKKFNRMQVRVDTDRAFELGVGFGISEWSDGVTRSAPLIIDQVMVPASTPGWPNRFADQTPVLEDSVLNQDPWSNADAIPDSVSTPGLGVGFDCVLSTHLTPQSPAPPHHTLKGLVVFAKGLRETL